MVEHHNPELRARQELSLARSRATLLGWNTREGARELYASMMDKLLRAMDRRDPWTSADLSGWVRHQFPEFLENDPFDNPKLAAFAEQIAVDLKDDPAFPLIVDNLKRIATEFRSISAGGAGDAP